MTDPYKIVCPKCNQEISLEESPENQPEICPFCHQPLGDDYTMQYQPSTGTKTYRILAMAILIFFILLTLLGVTALLLHR